MAGKKWTNEEDMLLGEIKDLPNEDEIVTKFEGRSWRAIQNRMSTLGLSRSVSDHDRFWSRVDKDIGVFGADGEYPTECWEWIGHRNEDGYGSGFKAESKTWLSHRYSWRLANGEIGEGKIICHKCDNPACVRPEHLFEGTHKDNSDDKHNKGREADKRGTNNGRAVLSESKVLKIRELNANGIPVSEIAKEFGVCEVTIRSIVKLKTWSHVCGLRRFIFVRSQDISGISGDGIVGEGVETSNGQVVFSWKSHTASFGIFPNVRAFLAVHGHNGAGEIVWLDPDPTE